MAGRMKHGWLLLAVCIYVSLAANAAQAAETVSRYSFELHGTEPLLGSRWEQPQHEVWRFMAAAQQFSEEHPHQGQLAAKLYTAWWSPGSDGDDWYCRAFLTMVVEDQALQQTARDWLEQQAGVQTDTIKLEQADMADPFVQHPPVDIIINGESYRYPGDFEGAEREWLEYFTRTNYPNQTMFIVHPDERVTGRLGLGELSRAVTVGDGAPIVIDTLQDEFDLGEIEIPAGLELYPQFLPSHLVPESEAELEDYLLGEIRRRVETFAKNGNGGSDHWWICSYPIDMLGEASIDASIGAAQSAFDDWLADYPLHRPDGPLFGSCTMQTVEAQGRPVELLVRMQDMDIAGRRELQRRLADVWIYPDAQYSLSSGLIGIGQPLERINEYGLKLGTLSEMEYGKDEARDALDTYLSYRADIHPGLDEPVAELAEENGLLLLKTSLPSQAELARMRGWLKRELPGNPQLLGAPGVWDFSGNEPELVSGVVEINGERYSYPEDFADVDARQLEHLLNPHRNQRVLSIFEGIDYQPLEDAALDAKFGFGDLAMIEKTEDGIRITTLERHWEHGVDIDSIGMPQGFSPSLYAVLPIWFGDDPLEIREYARRRLANYRPMVLDGDDTMQTSNENTYRSIIANPIPTTDQQALFRAEQSEEPTEAEMLATLEMTRSCYDAVLEWMADNGLATDELSIEPHSNLSFARVNFHANEMRGFVQQIQIAVAGFSEEQMIELMDRICLASGMRDVWGRYDGNIYPSVLAPARADQPQDPAGN